MRPVVTAFSWVPHFARGHVRDLRIRWALEELGIAYDVHKLDARDEERADYRDWQPFGQVPAFDDGTVRLFESGAILLHLAERYGQLLPAQGQDRARALSWTFAALNTLEPHVMELGEADIFHAGERWTETRRPQIVEAIEKRLDEAGTALGDRTWMAGPFSIADILMVTVLRDLDEARLSGRVAALAALKARGEARPAFQRALAAQLADFTEEKGEA